MFCPNCGNNCDNDQKFCPECGEPIAQVKRNEQNESSDEIIFEPHTKKAGGAESERQNKPAKAAKPAKPKNDDYDDEDTERMSASTVLLIIVSCLLVLAVIFAVVYALVLNRKDNPSNQGGSTQITTDAGENNTTEPTTVPVTVTEPTTVEPTTETPTTEPTTEPTTTTEAQTYPSETRHFVYTGVDIPVNYRPILELKPDGKFELTEVYSGSYITLSGTYTENGTEINLTVEKFSGLQNGLVDEGTHIVFGKANDGSIIVQNEVKNIATTRTSAFARDESYVLYNANYRSYKNQGKTAKVNSPEVGFLNMRSEPNTSGQKLTTIPNGTQISLLGETYDQTWAYVKYVDGNNTFYGWVSEDYIVKE